MPRTLAPTTFLLICTTAIAAENWANWRGPDRNGTSDATNLPASWSETENVQWKVPLPSWSGATPIIWGDRIFITSASKPAPGDPPLQRRGGGRDPGGPDILLLCLSKKDGSLLWQKKLTAENMLNRKQNMSSPSPVTDGKHVWALTGNGILTAFDMDGKQIWQRDIQKAYGKFGLNWGYASSPLLIENKLIVQVLHGMFTDDPSYIVAFNPQTGEALWKVNRPTDAPKEAPDDYSTPAVLRYPKRIEIVVSGGDYVTGHDLATGREIWRVGGLNPTNSEWCRTIASPLAINGTAYATSRKKPLLAIKAGGSGDITNSHVVWKNDLGPDVPTPACDGKFFYVLDDQGLVTCLDAKTGKPHYAKQRIARGTYSASPLLADGKLYATSESATTTVLAAGPQFKIITQNKIDDEYVLSSFAVSNQELYLRSSTHLYCISKTTQ